VKHRGVLEGIVHRWAGAVRRFEDSSDIVQGVCAQALSHDHGFTYQGERAFLAWMEKLARNFVANRRRYWKSLKRDGGRMLRISGGDLSEGGPGIDPQAPGTEPSTFAERREQYILAAKAISLLLPRDQQIIAWFGEGLSIGETAARLDISHDAAERARLRAVERFRKVAGLLLDGGQRGGA
jgi:RNA polymerase sigma factor (sigma-70 family)